MGVISAVLRHDGNKENFIKLSIFLNKKLADISEFSLIVLLGISEFWQAFYAFNFLVSFSMSVTSSSVKQNVSAFLN